MRKIREVLQLGDHRCRWQFYDAIWVGPQRVLETSDMGWQIRLGQPLRPRLTERSRKRPRYQVGASRPGGSSSCRSRRASRRRSGGEHRRRPAGPPPDGTRTTFARRFVICLPPTTWSVTTPWCARLPRPRPVLTWSRLVGRSWRWRAR